MKWSNEYRVHYYYTDYSNILKPGYIARYMQETAWNALKEWGPAPKYLKERCFAFILSKISFRYYKEIYEDDVIKVETWAVPPSKSVIFTRNYRIYKEGGVAAEAASAWDLMDMKERTVLKPEVLGENFKGFDDEELSFGVQKRFKIPDAVPETYSFCVRYADIDTNLHMNNAVYIDLVSECIYNAEDKLSADLKKSVLSIDFNYNSEAVYGDIIEIEKTAAPNLDNKEFEEIYLSGKVKSTDKNCFEAKTVVRTGMEV